MASADMLPAIPRRWSTRRLSLSAGQAGQREFLPAALEILETPASPAGRMTVATIVLAMGASLAWAGLGQVDIVASATGTVVPAGRVKVVQPLESGVVRAILVGDGDRVSVGQPLIELDATVVVAERDRIARELRQARLDVAGLRALRQDLLAGAGLGSFVVPEAIPVREVEVTRAVIAARRAAHQAKLAVLEQQVAQKAAEAESNAAMVARLEATLPLDAQREDLRRQLLRQEWGNRLAWLDAQQALLDHQHELRVQRRKVFELEAGRRALEQQAVEEREGYAHEVLRDLAGADQKQAELEQQLAAAAHRVTQAILTAPVTGVVQQLAAHSLGGVVTPAERLMVVVPEDAPVLIEAVVENRDIGFVHEGQPVEVKVEAFPFTRYGLLHGTVVGLSHDAARSSDEGTAGLVEPSRRGETVTSRAPGAPQAAGYTARMALERASLTVDGREVPLAPGMAVTAEIKTGQRSVLSYLLSPLKSYKQEAVRER